MVRALQVAGLYHTFVCSEQKAGVNLGDTFYVDLRKQLILYFSVEETDLRYDFSRNDIGRAFADI